MLLQPESDSLYTDAVRRYVQSRPWPRGLKMEVREPTEPAPHLMFYFFRDNWITFDGEDQKYISEIVREVMMKLRKDGVPCYMGAMQNATEG